MGRHWNIDPKPNVSYSPYVVFEDNPIWRNDIKGDTTVPAPARVQVGTMDYYVKRAEDFVRRNPGKPAPTYYLSYGNVYINKFKKETKIKLSRLGQQWLEKALVNLQLAIERKVQSDRNIENDDRTFTDFAFETHVKAYEDAGVGVLALPVMDKVNILLTPSAEDLFSDRGLKQAAKIAEDQFVYFFMHPLFAADQVVEAFTNMREIKDMVHNYYIQNKKYFDEAVKTNPQGWAKPEQKIMGIVRDILFPTFKF